MSLYIYTWTVLEPHNFRSLRIFGRGPKNHFWAKSDGFNDTALVSKSWSFASFLRHFASYFWSFQMWLTEGKISNCSIFGRSLLFSPDQKKCSFWMSRYIYIYINIISYIYRLYMSRGKYLVHHAIDRVFLPRSPVPWRFLGSHLIFDGRTCF